MIVGKRTSDLWPALSSSAFAPTRYLLHMALQAVGKLKLTEPFQAQWAEVPLWLSARGLTTGPISYAGGVYEVRADFISHEMHAHEFRLIGTIAAGPDIRRRSCSRSV